jgi:TonB family protein
MRIGCLLILLIATEFGLFSTASKSSAQAPPSSELRQQQVVISKLSPPIYPPLARVARVTGDVEVELRIRPDGAVESADVVRGHPLLKEAALDSAKKSEFQCHDCKEIATYSISYTFGFASTEHCCEAPQQVARTEQTTGLQAGVVQSPNHVTILVEPFCICDPRADVIKVRSVRCLFLWHCGKRYGS